MYDDINMSLLIPMYSNVFNIFYSLNIHIFKIASSKSFTTRNQNFIYSFIYALYFIYAYILTPQTCFLSYSRI